MSKDLRFDLFTEETFNEFKNDPEGYLYDHVIADKDSFFIDSNKCEPIYSFIIENMEKIYDTYYYVDLNKLQDIGSKINIKEIDVSVIFQIMNYFNKVKNVITDGNYKLIACTDS